MFKLYIQKGFWKGNVYFDKEKEFLHTIKYKRITLELT